jgi:hypothetical protein
VYDAVADDGDGDASSSSGEGAAATDAQYRDIAPVANRLVLFRADVIEHEVRPCFKNIPRYAVTVWIYGKVKRLVDKKKESKMLASSSSLCSSNAKPAVADGTNDNKEELKSASSSLSHDTIKTTAIDNDNSKIFVSIPNYGDSECPHTINDLMTKARQERGDAKLLEQINKCPKPHQTIMTTYPAGYTLPWTAGAKTSSRKLEMNATVLVPSDFKDGILRQKSKVVYDHTAASPTVPIKALPLFAGGFNFSHSSSVQACPYNARLDNLFFGEEMYMAVRLFTRGYDFYAPGEAIVWHLWDRTHRKEFFTDASYVVAAAAATPLAANRKTEQDEKEKGGGGGGGEEKVKKLSLEESEAAKVEQKKKLKSRNESM